MYLKKSKESVTVITAQKKTLNPQNSAKSFHSQINNSLAGSKKLTAGEKKPSPSISGNQSVVLHVVPMVFAAANATNPPAKKAATLRGKSRKRKPRLKLGYMRTRLRLQFKPKELRRLPER